MALASKMGRRIERLAYGLRQGLGLLPKRGAAAGARLGIYVAYFDSSRYYRTHLECFARNTEGPFNYYVMKNCTTKAEAAAFDGFVGEYGFPHVFARWPSLEPLTHGESLQRMIEMTDDEVIVLCDVDAFPIRAGWDDYVLEQLETHDVVSVIAHFPHRERMPVFLHPCFMAFRRGFMRAHGLDVLAGEGHDPAWRFTRYLMGANAFDEAHVAGLFPTRREIDIPNSRPDARVFGRTDLLHGFGTTYSDLVFHFWFSGSIRKLTPVYNDDGQLVITAHRMAEVVDAVNRRYGPAACPR
jgi:hypothetical protein